MKYQGLFTPARFPAAEHYDNKLFELNVHG